MIEVEILPRLRDTGSERVGKGRVTSGPVERDVARLRRIGDERPDAGLHLRQALAHRGRARSHRAGKVRAKADCCGRHPGTRCWSCLRGSTSICLNTKSRLMVSKSRSRSLASLASTGTEIIVARNLQAVPGVEQHRRIGAVDQSGAKSRSFPSKAAPVEVEPEHHVEAHRGQRLGHIRGVVDGIGERRPPADRPRCRSPARRALRRRPATSAKACSNKPRMNQRNHGMRKLLAL